MHVVSLVFVVVQNQCVDCAVLCTDTGSHDIGSHDTGSHNRFAVASSQFGQVTYLHCVYF